MLMVVLRHMLMGLLMVSTYALAFVLCFLHVGAAYALLAVPTKLSSTACKQGLNEAALLNVTPTPGLVHDSNLLLLRVLS